MSAATWAKKDQDAANALVDLHLAAVIMAMTEGSFFRTSRGRRFAERLAKQCAAHRQQQFRAYERVRTGGAR
jgi:hypothetical protein